MAPSPPTPSSVAQPLSEQSLDVLGSDSPLSAKAGDRVYVALTAEFAELRRRRGKDFRRFLDGDTGPRAPIRSTARFPAGCHDLPVEVIQLLLGEVFYRADFGDRIRVDLG